jgi:hypothetical protein
MNKPINEVHDCIDVMQQAEQVISEHSEAAILPVKTIQAINKIKKKLMEGKNENDR